MAAADVLVNVGDLRMEETEPDYVKVELDSSKGEDRGTSIMITITPSYAAILGLLFFVLSVRALRLRRKLKIAIGDAGNPQMLRAMRVHANFAEYTAFTLLLGFMLEFQGAHYLLVHALCLCLLVGRISHAYGVSKELENYRYRVFGMSMTFTALVGSAASLLVLQVGNLIT